MWFIRIGCAVYWLLLTVALLVPDPLALLGIASLPGPPGGRMVHFILFAVFGLLVCASRLPMPRAALVGLLAAYAVVTEACQLLVPDRTVELLDFLENLLGLAAGGGLWYAIERRFVRPRSPESGQTAPAETEGPVAKGQGTDELRR